MVGNYVLSINGGVAFGGGRRDGGYMLSVG